jgi:TonB family protein
LDRQKEGFVEFEFTINPDGTVANPKIINEYPEHMGFRESAKEAFRGFTFAPDIVDGSPIATPARYRMVFKMH